MAAPSNNWCYHAATADTATKGTAVESMCHLWGTARLLSRSKLEPMQPCPQPACRSTLLLCSTDLLLILMMISGPSCLCSAPQAVTWPTTKCSLLHFVLQHPCGVLGRQVIHVDEGALAECGSCGGLRGSRLRCNLHHRLKVTLLGREHHCRGYGDSSNLLHANTRSSVTQP